MYISSGIKHYSMIFDQLDILYEQVGTDTGYFPTASFAPSCHYVLNTSGPTNMTEDHSHF